MIEFKIMTGWDNGTIIQYNEGWLFLTMMMIDFDNNDDDNKDNDDDDDEGNGDGFWAKTPLIRKLLIQDLGLSLIHISEPTRPY